MAAFSRVLCHPLEEGDPVDNYIIKSDSILDSRSSNLSDECLRVDDLRGNDNEIENNQSKNGLNPRLLQ